MKRILSWRHIARNSPFRIDERILLIFISIIVGACSGLAALALSHALVFFLDFFHHIRAFWWAFLTMTDADIYYGDMKQCVDSAVSGRWEA